jgi:hypothetical protein
MWKQKTLRAFFIPLLIISISTSAFGQWQKVFQFPTATRAIYFLDQFGHPEIGFVGLIDGSIWRTQDDGTTWQREFTDPNGLSVTDITFKDRSTGWFCTAPYIAQTGSASVYRTNDAGSTWQLVESDLGGIYSAIYYFKPQKTLYLSNWTRGQLSSNDDGNTWNLNIKQTDLNGYAFSDAQNGIVTSASGGGGDIYSTNDAGANWQIFFNVNAGWQPAAMPGTSSIFIFSEYTSSLMRRDGFGLVWQPISTVDQGSVNAFTGCLRIGTCTGQFYVQSAVGKGLYTSGDDGATWQNIGGPSNGVDSRFWISSNLVFASDLSGALWAYVSPGNPILGLSSDTLSLFSGNCTAVDSIVYLHLDFCDIGFDSIISAAFSPLSPFRLSAGENVPRKFLERDSMKILYTPTGSKDTTLLTLHLVAGGKGIDTVIRLYGDSPLPIAPFAPQLTTQQGNHQMSVIVGKDTMLDFSVSKDIPASGGLDSISFDLTFDFNMLNLDRAQAPAGWKITIDSVKPGFYHCTFFNVSHSDITADQTLATFLFTPFLSIDTVSVVNLKPGNVFFDSSIHQGCSTESLLISDSVIVQKQDICGDATIRQFLKTGSIGFSIISVHPNPAQNEINIETESATSLIATVIISDDLGREWQYEKTIVGGRNDLMIPISLLPAGNYHIMLKSASNSATVEFVKVR